MRGGVTVLDLLHVFSFEDREAISVIIKENLETTKQIQMPFV